MLQIGDSLSLSYLPLLLASTCGTRAGGEQCGARSGSRNGEQEGELALGKKKGSSRCDTGGATEVARGVKEGEHW